MPRRGAIAPGTGCFTGSGEAGGFRPDPHDSLVSRASIPLAPLNALPGKTLCAQAPQSLPRKGGGACAPPSLNYDAVAPLAL